MPKNDKPAANKANKIRTQLDELPSGFARTVIVDYILSQTDETKIDLIRFLKDSLEIQKRERKLISISEL